MATVSVPQVQKGKNAGPRQLRVFLGAFFILAAVGVLIYGSLQGTQQYYMTLAEMRARKDVASLQSVRIGGGLAPNTTVVNSKEVIRAIHAHRWHEHLAGGLQRRLAGHV